MQIGGQACGRAGKPMRCTCLLIVGASRFGTTNLCWMWEHMADTNEAEGCCIERATASDYIHDQMSKQMTNRVT